jgi:hypothetical protein
MVSRYLPFEAIVDRVQDILTPALNRRRLKLIMSDSETEDEVMFRRVIVVTVNLLVSHSMPTQL